MTPSRRFDQVGHVSRALRRLAVAVTLVALSAATRGATGAWGQDEPSGTGHKDVGESASAWHRVLALLGWILLALVVCSLLVWMAIGRRRGGATPSEEPDAAEPAMRLPPPSPVDGSTEAGEQQLTVLTFDHVEGAERAHANARGRAGDAPWLRDVAFVECHRHGRIGRPRYVRRPLPGRRRRGGRDRARHRCGGGRGRRWSGSRSGPRALPSASSRAES